MNYTKAKDLQVGWHVYRWGEEDDKQDEVLAVIIEENRVGVQWDWGSYVIWYKPDHPLVVVELQDKRIGEKEFYFCDMDSIYLVDEWLTTLDTEDCDKVRIVVYKLGIQE